MNRRPGLTRQVLVEAGLRLLDEVGLDGLTVRRLAASLGVQSPALYWHIRTKQELLDGMAEAILLEAGMGPAREDESWQEWLARRTRAYRGALLGHRDGARVVAGAASLGPETVRTFDEELAGMVARGFTPVLALRTISALSNYATGFVLQEQATPAGSMAGLLEQEAPATLVAAVREGGSPFSEEAFEQGLQTLIRGTESAL